MFCTRCGFKNKDTSKFCEKCGEKLVQLKPVNTEPSVEQAKQPVVEMPVAQQPVVDSAKPSVIEQSAEDTALKVPFFEQVTPPNSGISQNDGSSNQNDKMDEKEDFQKKRYVLILLVLVLVLTICVVVRFFSGNNDSISISDDTTIEETVIDTTKKPSNKNNKEETDESNTETEEDGTTENANNNDEDVEEPAIYFSNIEGLSFEEAEKKLNNAGVSCYATYVYSSSYDYGTVVGEARNGWSESSYAYSGDKVELLFSCGPVEDSWSYDEQDYDFGIIVEDVCLYNVYELDMGGDVVDCWYSGESWETVYEQFVQYATDENDVSGEYIIEDDVPIDGSIEVYYEDGDFASWFEIECFTAERWRCDYETWD